MRRASDLPHGACVPRSFPLGRPPVLRSTGQLDATRALNWETGEGPVRFPWFALALVLLLWPGLAPAQGCPGEACEQGVATPLAPGKAGLSPATRKVAS